MSCKLDLPLTNDHQNPNNKLYQKFSFEPRVKSATSYLYFQRKGITQKLLHEVKYNGKKELAEQLGIWFSKSFKHFCFDMIIPVPLHKSKIRKRTYNQSELMAKGISEELKIPIRTDLVKRIVATQTQTAKSKTERWLNVSNVYSKPDEDLSNLSVLVVDDVITTGATVGMLCQRLIQCNVREIHIASIARGK
ncbi:ComF family protein [Ekhidna sp.]